MTPAERAVGGRWAGSAVGVLVGGLTVGLVAVGAFGWLGIEVAHTWVVGACLLGFALLEIPVRRAALQRRARAIALADSLVAPLAGALESRGGLPLVRVGETVVGFEPSGGVMRVVVVLTITPPLLLWAGPRGAPHSDAAEARLRSRGFEPLPGAPPNTLVLGPSGPATRSFVEHAGDALGELCGRPDAEFEMAEDVRWSAPAEAVEPQEVVRVVATLRALLLEDESE